jgi:hypothetical protein
MFERENELKPWIGKGSEESALDVFWGILPEFSLSYWGMWRNTLNTDVGARDEDRILGLSTVKPQCDYWTTTFSFLNMGTSL